jgi:4-aminobutyrate aminotransferase-like enzyme
MIGGGTPGPLLVRGQGARVGDVDGKSYLDCTSQSWAMYLGHNHPEINQVIAAQAGQLMRVQQSFETLPRLRFAAKLAALAPTQLNRVSFTVGGGLAVEAAMKICVRNNPRASEFICLWDAYHGSTLGTMGASWISTRARGDFAGGALYTNLTRHFARVPNPYCYRCPLGCGRGREGEGRGGKGREEATGQLGNWATGRPETTDHETTRPPGGSSEVSGPVVSSQWSPWATGQLGNQPQPLEPNFPISQFPSATLGTLGTSPACGLACAEMLRTTLERGVNGPCAGVIVEPIQASGGQIPAPPEYLRRVREICDEFGVPLIFDEVQTYLRIGTVFAADYYGVAPDVLCLGKGLGAGLPIAAILISDDLEGFGPDAEELHTFASHQLAQAAGLKLLEIVERDHVLDNVNAQGQWLAEQLAALQTRYPEIGDIRQVGLHVGVEFVTDPDTKRPLREEVAALRREAMARGVIFGLAGVRPNVLKIKPPLVVTRSECEEAISVLEESLAAVLGRR